MLQKSSCFYLWQNKTVFAFKIPHKWAVDVVGTAIVQNVGAKMGGGDRWLISSHHSVCRGGDEAHLRRALVLHLHARSLVSERLFAACALCCTSKLIFVVLDCLFSQRDLMPLPSDVFPLQPGLVFQSFGNFKIENLREKTVVSRGGGRGWVGGCTPPHVECHNSRWRVWASSSSAGHNAWLTPSAPRFTQQWARPVCVSSKRTAADPRMQLVSTRVQSPAFAWNWNEKVLLQKTKVKNSQNLGFS